MNARKSQPHQQVPALHQAGQVCSGRWSPYPQDRDPLPSAPQPGPHHARKQRKLPTPKMLNHKVRLSRKVGVGREMVAREEGRKGCSWSFHLGPPSQDARGRVQPPQEPAAQKSGAALGCARGAGGEVGRCAAAATAVRSAVQSPVHASFPSGSR